MANDAKLGLVLGVAVVLVIGLVFFRSEPSAQKLPATRVQQTPYPAKNAVKTSHRSAAIDATRAP